VVDQKPKVSNDKTVVVIGTGPPGAAAARSLARAGIPVTVLEAGSRRSAYGLVVQVRGMTVAQYRSRPLRLRKDAVTFTNPKQTVLFEELAPGGLSNHWSCAVPRFSREDFRDAERAGEAFTWPVK
jgi:choline dehydrogenase-like flavoprotein